MEYEFCIRLHEKLKAKLRGKVFCRVINDILNIVIENGDTKFEVHIDDFARKVCFGMTTDAVSREVEKKYRKFLLNRMERYYFRQEEEAQF